MASSMISNAMCLNPLFTLHTTKLTRHASTLRSRPERRQPLFCSSRVVFLSFFIPPLFLSCLQVHPYLKGSFFRKFFFPLVKHFFSDHALTVWNCLKQGQKGPCLKESTIVCIFLQISLSYLGHTKLILCFTDCSSQKEDMVGQNKTKRNR